MEGDYLRWHSNVEINDCCLSLFPDYSLSLAGPTTNQALSKQSKAESGGVASTDIKIENFDIAFGGRVLLSNAELSLSYGRRYGLVGRNGR